MKYIEIIIFLVSFGYSLFTPVFQQTIFHNLCLINYNATDSHCYSENSINHNLQQETSKWILFISFFQLFPVIISTLVINFISTKYSPENLLFFPCITLIVYIALGIVYTFLPHIPLHVFAPLNIIPAMFGGLSTFRALSTTYLSYITKECDRSYRFVLADAAGVVATSFASFLSGYLVTKLSFLEPQFIAVGVILAAALLSLLLDRAIPPNKRKIVTYHNFKSSLRSISQQVSTNKSVFVLIWLAQFFYSFGMVACQRLVLRYSMNTKFEFTPTMGGNLLAVYSITRGVGSLIILPILLKCCKIKEWILCMINIPIQCGFFLMNAFANTRFELFVAPTFLIFQDIYKPTFATILSKSFTGQSRALIFALQIVTITLASSFGIIASNYLYLITIHVYPGLVYIVFGSISVFASVLGTYIYRVCCLCKMFHIFLLRVGVYLCKNQITIYSDLEEEASDEESL